jgi:DMSO reductase anchor subunit
MFAFPIAEFNAKYLLDVTGAFLLDRSQTIDTLLPFPMYYIVVSLAGLLLFCILQYRNRKQQITLCWLSYLLILGLVVLLYLSVDHIVANLQDATAPVAYGVSTYLPVVALVFVFLAKRAIKKDELLVSSQDRLR